MGVCVSVCVHACVRGAAPALSFSPSGRISIISSRALAVCACTLAYVVLLLKFTHLACVCVHASARGAAPEVHAPGLCVHAR